MHEESKKREDTPVEQQEVVQTIEEEQEKVVEPTMVIAADAFKAQAGKSISPEAEKLIFERSFALPFSAEAAWSIVSDWNLEYLKSYSQNIKVVIGTEKDFPDLPCRDVKLPNGEFHEILLFIDNETMEFEYIMTSGPLPFMNHLARFKVSPAAPATEEELVIAADMGSASGDRCVIQWHSEAYVVEGGDRAHAEAVLQSGVATSVQVIGHTLTTTLSEAGQ
jgi:hypothetical protein